MEEKAEKSRTTKILVESFIKPVFIMMMFVRAEKEGDWPLHLGAVEAMMTNFLRVGISTTQDMVYIFCAQWSVSRQNLEIDL